MKYKFIICYLLIVICALNCTTIAFAENITTKSKSEPTSSATITKNEYKGLNKYLIQPGDIISFSVYDEQTLTQPEIVVRPDGYATIEPIGELYIAGKDINDVTSLLKQKMALYMLNPEISVNIKEFHPSSAYIYGAVQKPGDYQQITQLVKMGVDSKNPVVKTDFTVVNAISNAGGLTYDADIANITVENPSTAKKRVLNLWKLINDGDISQNLTLQSGDVIHVPKLLSMPPNDENFKLLANSSLFPTSFPVRIIGEVNKVGVYDILSNNPYLGTVLATAGGYTIDANKKAVKIYRKSLDGRISEINVDPQKVDYVLRPNDMIEVKGRKLLKGVRGAEYISKILSPATSATSGLYMWEYIVNPNRGRAY